MASVFTKIVKGEIPAYKIAEEEHFLAFLDIFPLAKGHVLVVPKVQIDYLFDLEENIYHHLWEFVRLVQKGLKKSVSCSRIGVSVVGFEVPHAHIHLVPINQVSEMNFSNKFPMKKDELENSSKKISINI